MKQKLYKLNNRGAALIAGLLILVVLSILGVTTMQSSLLQERMAGNFEQVDVAFQLAEAGLRDGEAWLDDPIFVVLPPPESTPGFYSTADSLSPCEESTWHPDNDDNYMKNEDSEVPLYYIERLSETLVGGDESLKLSDLTDDFPVAYRVTSRGVSPNGRSVVILQSTFVR